MIEDEDLKPLNTSQEKGMCLWHFEEDLINKRVSWLAVFQSLLFSGLVLSEFSNELLFWAICSVGITTSVAGAFGVASGISAQIGWGKRYKLFRRKTAWWATLLGWCSPSLLVVVLLLSWSALLFSGHEKFLPVEVESHREQSNSVPIELSNPTDVE